MNSPKERFQKTEAAKAHAELAHNPDLITALDVTMAQLVHAAARAGDQSAAAAAFWRIEGARAFMNAFLNLSNVPLQQPYSNPDSLPHE